ncbi:MAG: hypothetical protein JW863_01705 [Chitinispirillaceae bacterium]|nr:hypothetical protein [Chitinispirillaceae bacterium]
MKTAFLIFYLLTCSAFSQSITLSRDSLWVRNSDLLNRDDTILVTNHGLQAVWLDSAGIILTGLYTGRLQIGITSIQVMLAEYRDSVRNIYYFSIDSTSPGEHRLLSPVSKPMFSIGASGGTTVLGSMRIGGNFFGDIPVYPQFVEGLLRLYFSNGEVIGINFYSDDLRPTVVKSPFRIRSRHTIGNEVQYLINGRMVSKGVNGMNREHLRYRLYQMNIGK